MDPNLSLDGVCGYCAGGGGEVGVGGDAQLHHRYVRPYGLVDISTQYTWQLLLWPKDHAQQATIHLQCLPRQRRLGLRANL